MKTVENTIKNVKGITLIALAITIIVLLILASVTINIMFGENGLIHKTQVSKNTYERARLQEKINIELADAKIEAITNRTELTTKAFAQRIESMGIAAILDDIDLTNVILKTNDGYTIVITQDNNGNIIAEVSKEKVNSSTPISITGMVTAKNTNSITVQVTGENNEEATYTYTILLDGTRIQSKITTDLSYTFTKLTHNTDYTITVKANNINGLAIARTNGRTDEVKGLAVGGAEWLREEGNGQAKVTITNTSGIVGSKIRYKAPGDTEYKETIDTTANIILTVRNNETQTVEALLDDGTGNTIVPVYRQVADTTPPEGKIKEQPESTVYVGQTVTAIVELKDGESGINPDIDKTVFTTTGDAEIEVTTDIAKETAKADTKGVRTVTVTMKPKTKGEFQLIITPRDWAENTGNVIVYDKITVLQQFTISYNSLGGNITPVEQKKDFGNGLTLSTDIPTKTNYEFLGWSTSENGEVEYQPGQIYQKDENATLYAKWRVDKKYRFIRIEVTKLRSSPNNGAIQMSEWNFYNSEKQRFNYPSTTTISANLSRKK